KSKITRGRSLSADLRPLVNNPHYSDLEILCKDGVILHGIRSILAARSHTMEQILYASSTISSHPPTPQKTAFSKDFSEKYPSKKDIYEKYVVLPDIDSTSLILILEYLYTGSMSTSVLNVSNVIEMYHAAEYFQLDQLAAEIEEYLRQCIKDDKNALKIPELFSKAFQLLSHMKSPLFSENVEHSKLHILTPRGKPQPSLLVKHNGVISLLMESASKVSLDLIEVGALSFNTLQYFLSHTFDDERFTSAFASSEYSLLRYSILISAKKVSYEAFTLLERHLPKWKHFSSSGDEASSEGERDEGDDSEFKRRRKIPHNGIIQTIRENYSSSIYKVLTPLMEFINLRRINGRILADWVEPLGILPSRIVMEAFKFHLREKVPLPPFRGNIENSAIVSPKSLQLVSPSSTLISRDSTCSSTSSHHTRSSSSIDVIRSLSPTDSYYPHSVFQSNNSSNAPLQNEFDLRKNSDPGRLSTPKNSNPKVVRRFLARKNSDPNIVFSQISFNKNSDSKIAPLQRFSVRKNSDPNILIPTRKNSAGIITNLPLRYIPSLLSQQSNEPPLSSTTTIVPPQSTVAYDLKWSANAIGNNLQITEDGCVVSSHTYFQSQAARADHCLTSGFHEWDIILEKLSEYACIGVCTEEYDCVSTYGRNPMQGWYLCTDNGNFVHGQKVYGNINTVVGEEIETDSPKADTKVAEFKRGTIVTVHLDMELKRIGFSVDGRRYPDVEGWDDLADKLYPFVIMKPNNQIRIQSRVSI
ncbi:7402_t:CDS:1, partial [Acaulospora morrowiae]